MSKQAYEIRALHQIEALVSTVRQEIVDTVAALGTCSIAEVADALGRPADGLYYHVRALLDAGLLVDAGERETSRRPEALVRAPTRGVMRLKYAPEDSRNVAAINKVVASMLRSAERDFRAGFDPQAVCSGRQRNLNASRQKAWLSKADVREINDLLLRLQELLSQSTPEPGRELHSLTVVMAPIRGTARRR